VKQLYKRVENIDEKVKNASLPYLQWKILFLIGEHSDATEISSLLGEDVSKINDLLASLESDGFIEIVQAVKEESTAGEKKEKAEEPGLGDELLIEENLVSDQEENIVDESEEQADEQKPAASAAEEPKAAESKKDIVEVNTDFLTEDMIPVDEADKIKKREAATETDSSDEFDAADVSESETEDFDLGLDIDEDNQEQEAVAEVTQKEEPAAADGTADEEIISDISKKTIIVIDDSIVIRKMIEIALEDEDFNIITAISGKEGLEIIEARKPNLVILDMMLPDMNGIDVLKAIKGSQKIPVIMLSGKDSPQLIESAKEVGVDDFLPKPFRDEDLVGKVKNLVGA
jgi:CheY-like chemotaxis protein